MPQIGRGDAKRFTREKREEFLAGLRRGLSVGGAAQATGFSRETVYRHAARDRKFSAEWDAAVERGTDLLEDVATQRAVAGPQSDTLLIFLLKARRPEKYRERLDLTTGGKELFQSFADAMTRVQTASVQARAQQEFLPAPK